MTPYIEMLLKGCYLNAYQGKRLLISYMKFMSKYVVLSSRSKTCLPNQKVGLLLANYGSRCNNIC